jgi:hypothetical protein
MVRARKGAFIAYNLKIGKGTVHTYVERMGLSG